MHSLTNWCILIHSELFVQIDSNILLYICVLFIFFKVFHFEMPKVRIIFPPFGVIVYVHLSVHDLR